MRRHRSNNSLVEEFELKIYVTSQIHFFLGYSHSTTHHGQVLSPDYLLLKFLFQESQRNFLPNYPKHSDGNKDSKEVFIITVSQNTVLQTLMKKRFNEFFRSLLENIPHTDITGWKDLLQFSFSLSNPDLLMRKKNKGTKK